MTHDTATLLELDAVAGEDSPDSAFVAIGGASAVSAVVEEFYARLLVDPVTAEFFTPLTASGGIVALKRHQVLMLAKVLGGPDRYTGRDLQIAHRSLDIGEEVYRRVSLHLLTVMHDFKVPMDILQDTDGILRGVASLIVTADRSGVEAGR